MSAYVRIISGDIVLLVLLLASSSVNAQPAREVGGWIIERDELADVSVWTMEMTLHARAEPTPALQYRFLPDDFEQDGNAASYYLKAMGFLDRDGARDRLREIYQQADERSRREDKPARAFPPYTWQTMKPEELPLEEVRDFLKLTSFQTSLLEEARQRSRLDMQRNLATIDDPLGYLLPEIQSMRQMARMQSLRCKLAIADGRVLDALPILGQQYALARHLGQDDFIVSALVGLAVAGIAWDDALYLVQHEDTPNLYWAFASLPDPLVNMRHAISVERQFLLLQFKVLREVDERPRPVGYWRDFLDRLVKQFGSAASEFGVRGAEENPAAVRAKLVALIAAAYPSAKRYLMRQHNLSADQLTEYPTAQVVFLAIVRYYEDYRDDQIKWACLPFWQALSATGLPHDERKQSDAGSVGWIAEPAHILLPAMRGVLTALARTEQQLAMVQTVEAIRMYGAANDGGLPPTLKHLPVPAPLDPFNGEPFRYQFHGEHAVLTAHDQSGLRYRLVLRFVR